MKDGNDRGVSVMTSVFYKPLFNQANADEAPALIRHARDTWLPQTLNCLYDEDSFILDMVESLTSSLALLVFVFQYEKKNVPGSKLFYSQYYIDTLQDLYFEPLMHIIESSQQLLDEQLQ